MDLNNPFSNPAMSEWHAHNQQTILLSYNMYEFIKAISEHGHTLFDDKKPEEKAALYRSLYEATYIKNKVLSGPMPDSDFARNTIEFLRQKVEESRPKFIAVIEKALGKAQAAAILHDFLKNQ